MFNEDAMREHLLEKPARYPGCSGARNLSDNFADLRAQTGANQKGINLISQLVEEYSLETVLVCLFPMTSRHTIDDRLLEIPKPNC